jgi:hypothetical protein
VDDWNTKNIQDLIHDIETTEGATMERGALLNFFDYVRHLEETVRIYKVSDEIVKDQSKKVKHLFPMENTAGYGQLCDLVLSLERRLQNQEEFTSFLEHENQLLYGRLNNIRDLAGKKIKY